MEKKRMHIATSGWHYGHWIGPFYPVGVRKKDLLGYYCTRFNTVEINNSFYRLPDEKTLAMWRETVPEDFIFSVKASRFITHMKRLNDPDRTLPAFFERMASLGAKLGPVLFQLPPRFKVDMERFEEFLKALPGGRRYAFEFRDTSWFEEGVYEMLKKYNAAFCIYDLDFILSPREITADFIYVRLHGPAGRYRGRYGDGVLSDWAEFFSRSIRKVKAVYCYFDNDEAGYAPQDAWRLIEMLQGSGCSL